MIIHHRGIYPDRFDTPFGLGTLIFAKDCHHNCRGCFHQDKRTLPVIEETSYSIVQKVLCNAFSQGIVCGGFEWTEQYEELLDLIEEARLYNLQVILYTHCTIEEISTTYKELLNYKGLYIKCGGYDDTLLSPTYTSYDVPLASTNQRIYRVGVDC